MGHVVVVQPIHEWKKEKGLTNYYVFSTDLWEKEVPFSVSLEKPLEELNIQEKYLLVKIVTKEINWVENNKEMLIDALVDDGMLELAEDWVSGAQEVEGKEACYEVENGQQVQLPISKKDFAGSLFFNSLGITFDADLADFSMTMYLECSPDYFAYHAINVSYNANHEIEVDGLCG
ncbi:DUF2262 domain-containing protein [Enterococcus sp. BWM-S5]|uniref:DUF2262 domain-containing protein n=1 Tax=Enterococcus larvae TaxID=2794352 RepID=A0ABS4CI51_9ENTE|nr:DUF2262 domain-containing protein [Enterococcus larvae]MBP1045863.1 DUF2262 domain-containing protein [Enterococcus larvae]